MLAMTFGKEYYKSAALLVPAGPCKCQVLYMKERINNGAEA